MTPAEFERAQWAYLKSERQRHKDIIELAWWTEILHRQKTVPPLHVLQNPPRILVGEEKQKADEDHEKLLREMGVS